MKMPTEERKKSYKIHEVTPDPQYESILVSRFINKIMIGGKKSVARKALYGVFDNIKKKTKRDPVEVFENAISNVSPTEEVRSKRVGGATYQVPMKVDKKRAASLAMRWIIEAARSKKGKPIVDKLFEEITSAANNEGAAVKKKENIHRMARANKAFAYLAR